MIAGETEGWPLFIKNLENVQGTRRDVIFISTTFGKAPGAARVAGASVRSTRPTAGDGSTCSSPGQSVALSSSRRCCRGRAGRQKASLGRKALRDYLDFAKRGILVSTDENERAPDSDFGVGRQCRDVAGLRGQNRTGCCRLFHRHGGPQSGSAWGYLAAIECDGATYHSSASCVIAIGSARRFWSRWAGRKIHRIWSTDWFYDPRREIARLESFLEMRRALEAWRQRMDRLRVLGTRKILPAEAEIPDVFDARVLL